MSDTGFAVFMTTVAVCWLFFTAVTIRDHMQNQKADRRAIETTGDPVERMYRDRLAEKRRQRREEMAEWDREFGADSRPPLKPEAVQIRSWATGGIVRDFRGRP